MHEGVATKNSMQLEGGIIENIPIGENKLYTGGIYYSFIYVYNFNFHLKIVEGGGVMSFLFLNS